MIISSKGIRHPRNSWHQKTETARAQVPQKLLDFFDSDMHQIFEFERFLFD